MKIFVRIRFDPNIVCNYRWCYFSPTLHNRLLFAKVMTLLSNVHGFAAHFVVSPWLQH